MGCCFSQEADNWGCHVCCLLTPHPSTPILTDGLSVLPVYTFRSAHIFASGFLQPVLTERISAFVLPFMLSITGLDLLIDCTKTLCYA
jgi:hypothetical protein